MRVLVSETETQWKEATMVLSNYKVGAGLAVSDMDRAREFYEGKLGLSVSIDSYRIRLKSSRIMLSGATNGSWLAP
jgi:catechol-2,3-dioxygenase